MSVLQTVCVRIFRFMIRLFSSFCFVFLFAFVFCLFVFFSGCTTNQSKLKSVKGQFFYHISFKNSVRTQIFNETDALQNWHTMTLGRLYFLYVIKQMHYKTGTLWHSDAFIFFTSAKVPSASATVVLGKRPYKISSKAMHRVCCFRWCRHVISWTADVWSELVSLISCILPPLPRFRAVTCDWPLCLQTRHMWRWLTSVNPYLTGKSSESSTVGPREPWLDLGSTGRFGEL